MVTIAQETERKRQQPLVSSLARQGKALRHPGFRQPRHASEQRDESGARQRTRSQVRRATGESQRALKPCLRLN